ncbi:MAG TPA: ABC transporter permease subunit [Candidatus Thiothrix moscowensis]|uniref:ABC transporter permease subunit n=1 Tax=unclassified Thiothrix TaxID=2636184 RepID=UPI001A1B1FD3|nr:MULTISPECIES: ABC transporter permease subunit [unclassified Thiothrix]MBJ6610797.1 ABC transporter permease subunit [Candidatus Thiothrix moscowensis]HRJ51143.1 ABC transporter permease subunit [Candidatus Thiothrix moscowensis]HRJ91802.1 ABC transporter permease subunit [Candidatus Thiothrix moscowensis]
MSAMWAIAITEFRRMFLSPLAWSILAVVQFILAWIFLLGLQEYMTQIQPLTTTMEDPPGISDLVVSALYLWAGIIMLAVMPLMTMRQFAEERMNQTLPLLTSSPLSSTQIVLGKYVGLLLFVLVMVGLLSLMPLSLALGTQLDWGMLASAALGLVLLLASFAAAGLFLSSLARQPVIAAVTTFGLLLFLVVLYISGKSQVTGSEVFVYLSHFGHFLSFLEGMFDSSDLLYYLLFIGGFLILTIRKLDNDRLQG